MTHVPPTLSDRLFEDLVNGSSSLQPSVDTRKKATEEDIARFMSYVDILPNGCWFWLGGRSRGKGNKKWYGTFRFQGQTVRAHRFSCEQIKGIFLEKDQHREHLCRFSLCVNPDHLEIVHFTENYRRSRLDHPPVTLDYRYVDGELELSLKIRS